MLHHTGMRSVLQGDALKSTLINLRYEHFKHRGAYKSLARPGRKQATATADFDFHISDL